MGCISWINSHFKVKIHLVWNSHNATFYQGRYLKNIFIHKMYFGSWNKSPVNI